MLLALFFTTFVTPFEVGLDLETTVNALFVVNQAVNVTFLIDIVVQFFLPFQSSQGVWEKSHSSTAANYLKSWFVIDIVSVLPLDVATAADAIKVKNPTVLRSVRLLRVLRLIKLLRILRTSRILTRWENRIGLTSSSKALIGYMCVISS